MVTVCIVKVYSEKPCISLFGVGIAFSYVDHNTQRDTLSLSLQNMSAYQE